MGTSYPCDQEKKNRVKKMDSWMNYYYYCLFSLFKKNLYWEEGSPYVTGFIRRESKLLHTNRWKTSYCSKTVFHIQFNKGWLCNKCSCFKSKKCILNSPCKECGNISYCTVRNSVSHTNHEQLCQAHCKWGMCCFLKAPAGSFLE